MSANLYQTISPVENISNDEEISLREYWEIVRRYRKTVIIIACTIFLTSISIALLQDKIYRVQIKVEKKQNKVRHTGALPFLTRLPDDPETLSQIIANPKIFKKVIKILPRVLADLAEEYTLTPKDLELAKSISATSLKDALGYEFVEDNENIMQITIHFQKSPLITSALALSFAKALDETLMDKGRKEYEAEIGVLQELQKMKNKEIKEIDAKILTQREKMSVTIGENETINDEQQLRQTLSQLEIQYRRAKLNLTLNREELNAIKKQLGIPNIDLAKVHWIDMTNSFRKKLQELRIKKQELETRYTKENPSIQKIEFEIESILKILKENDTPQKGMIDVKINRLQQPLVQDATKISREIKILEAEVETLRAERTKIRQHLYNFPIHNQKLQELLHRKKILDDLILGVTKSIQQVYISYKAKGSGIRILETPTPPSAPYSPKLLKTGAVGLFGGIGIGIIFALLLNLWDNTFQSSFRLKQELHYPVLGVVPRWLSDEIFIQPEEPDSVLAEVYGIMRNNIRFSSEQEKSVSIMMASAVQDEGKTITSQNLALSFALEGNNVLLVSMDFRSSMSFKDIQSPGYVDDGAGLTDYIRGEITKEKVLIPSCMSNLWLAPSGTPANNPTPLLKSKKITSFIKSAEESFDVIIIDAPAILPVVDATVICSMAKSVLMVVHADRTPIDVVKQAVSRLEHAKAKIVGTMLNQVKDIGLDSFYGHNYTYYPKYGHSKYQVYNAKS